ncbi:MAG: acetate kinase [Candidatus Mcinerneyibacterium aminivorans]|uniref:Acetate kinase n=1 Tax=Candidatus Mcinerneyibacterium aminivorans TaxID=2703815 RepID=A0A5D0MKZ5_9BACT|nr:MAG: acetate kinase [Candidatus Mcinerneyibacterium aminivorans]
MNILIINAGSSSIKFQLMDVDSEETKIKGLVQRINQDNPEISWKIRKEKSKKKINIEDHRGGLKEVLDLLVDKENGVLESYDQIDAVGHRYVHGGEKFQDSTLIKDELMKDFEKLNHLAPLHNPNNLAGVRAIKELIPEVPNVAVFDTSFHSKLPPKAYVYPLPYELYEEKGIRRYGFHGTSHHYVSMEAADMINKPYEEAKIITCHMGNGISFSAIDGGHSVDTSLGFSTVCGIPMGTRSGDFDVGLVTHLIKSEGYSVDEVHEMIYKKSGLLGVSGISNDARDVEKAAWEEGNERAQLALDILHYKAKKYIGSYIAAMNGLDALVFTAGIGENGWESREAICKDMEYLGIKLDKEKNRVRGKKADVSKKNSPVRILAIPTNEELMIAKETKRVVNNL